MPEEHHRGGCGGVRTQKEDELNALPDHVMFPLSTPKREKAVVVSVYTVTTSPFSRLSSELRGGTPSTTLGSKDEGHMGFVGGTRSFEGLRYVRTDVPCSLSRRDGGR